MEMNKIIIFAATEINSISSLQRQNNGKDKDNNKDKKRTFLLNAKGDISIKR